MVSKNKAPGRAEVSHKEMKDIVSNLIRVGMAQFETLLPYHAYDEINQFFINDSSVGFAYELGLFSGANEELANKLISFVNTAIPDDEKTWVQIVRWCNNKVGEQLDGIKAQTAKLGGVFPSLSENADQYYRYAALEGFPNPTKLPVCLRDNKLFMFVVKEVKNKKLEEVTNDLIRLREEIESDFKTNGFGFGRLNAEEFIGVLRDWVNPNHDDLYYSSGADYSVENSIKTQLTAANFELKVGHKNMEIELDEPKNTEKRIKTIVSSFSINRYPKKFALWQNADNFANVWKTAQTITGTFLFSFTFCVKNYERSKELAQGKFLDYDKLAHSPMGRLIPRFRQAAEEWDATRQEIENDNRKLMYCQPVLVLFSPKDKARQQASQVLSCFNSNGFELVKQQYIQMALYLSAFPFMAGEGLWKDLNLLGQIRMMRTSEAVSLFPVISDFKISNLGLLMPTFRHQFSCFYPFDEHLAVDNRNIAVAASSGSGKSFLIQAVVLDILSRGGKTWIIDKGASYRKICETLGGAYIDATTLSLNPFSNVVDINNEAPAIRDLIAVMASPAGELSSVQLSHLLAAVNFAFSKQGNEANIDAVVEGLKIINENEKDLRISDMVVLLQKYTTTGQYGDYFNKRSMLSSKSNFTVLELGGFEKNDELLRPVLFALILTIREQISTLPRDIVKFLAIDEAWSIFKGNNIHAKRFAEDTSRTIRKFGGSICTITQGLKDYISSPEAEAFWDNSAIKLILKQQDSSALKLTRNGEEILSAREQLIVGQFPAAKIGFSSILVKAGDSSSFNRFFVDPFKRILLSTEPKQYQAVENYRTDHNMSLEDAVLRVAHEYYGDEIKMVQKRLNQLTQEKTSEK